jgi:hypothetical protein
MRDTFKVTSSRCAVFVFTSAAFDGTLDVVLGHVLGAGFIHRQPQTEIRIDIAAAFARRNDELTRQARVKIAPRLASATPFLRLIVDHFE